MAETRIELTGWKAIVVAVLILGCLRLPRLFAISKGNR